MGKRRHHLTRRKFIADTTPVVAGAIAAAQLSPLIEARAAAPTPEFESNWHESSDRVWLGPEYWANPLQDWRVADGRIECVNRALDRNVHVLTRQLRAQEGTLTMSVRAGRMGGGPIGDGEGSVGFRIGILGTLRDYPELHDYRNNLWPEPGYGFSAGLAWNGTVFCGGSGRGHLAPSVELVELHLEARPVGGGAYDVTLTVLDGVRGHTLAAATQRAVPGDRLIGNLSLVNNFGTPEKTGQEPEALNFGVGQFWFDDWRIGGSKVVPNDAQVFGPILFSHYTLSGGTLKLTAQMPPLGDEDTRTVRLQVQDARQWKTIGEAPIDPDSRTATFRAENWDATTDVPYRVAYLYKTKSGGEDVYWSGIIRRDPIDHAELVVAVVSCNIHAIFPNVPLVENMSKLAPDLLAFVGDQFYENCGGYGTQRDATEAAIIDYLRKWYFHGWTWRELMRDRPSLSLPDDHDVYQGNLWGEGGDGRETTQEAGGYDMPSRWVNVVHRTQTAHHADPYDAEPGKRGTRNYYGPMTYGRVSFAVLADRQYKSGPEGRVPPTGDRGDHVIESSFDPKMADVPGLDLLGDKQMAFLKEWAADWEGADMKCVISQTIFTGLPTTHGRTWDVLFADYDTNGWPQTPRNAALREIRKAFAFHIAGDQHLPAVVHYGIEAHRDAGVAFAGPAVNVGYPRWWEPEKTGRNRTTATKGLTGDFLDHFGHPLTVLAVKNGPYQVPAPVLEQVNAKTSGLGLVRFNKERRTVTIDCWPYSADPLQEGTEMPGWPVVVRQTDNYARKAVAHLPTLKIRGVEKPVLHLVDERNGELVYALRLPRREFQPHVFAAGEYTVKISEPETGKVKVLPGLAATAENREALEVVV
ncbi:MAG: twin-arginine translocation pathway signal [Luteitalea sp.]|nr:twin-arginine translocation pathway signal [Luteitalea sp.]